jgi:hypothetical protein
MAQVSFRRPLTAEVRARARVSPRGTCGGQRYTGKVFFRFLRISPVDIIPAVPNTRTSSGDEQQNRVWPRFKDIFSPHQHEQ